MNKDKLEILHADVFEKLRTTIEKSNRRRRVMEDLNKLDHDDLVEIYNRVVQRLLSPE